MIYMRGHHLGIFYDYVLMQDSEARLKMKDGLVIAAAIEGRHSKKHGENIASLMRKALNPKEKIRLTDTIDDFCETCNEKKTRKCREFIPYDISAACEDRGVLHFYGLQKRTYTSKFIQERLVKRGRF